MIEKKFIDIKKAEFAVKEFVRRLLGKGKVSDIKIERTPVGERIIIHTSKPGVVIGLKGENIALLTKTLKEKFKLENPKVDIAEITVPEFDAQTMADQIALALERFGPNSFKMIAYRYLNRIKEAGALGVEIRLSGKLPGEKAKSWRFAYGYMKKTGELVHIIVKSAIAVAETKPGTIGIKVSIVPKGVQVGKVDTEIVEEEIKEEKKEKPAEGKEEKVEES